MNAERSSFVRTLVVFIAACDDAHLCVCVCVFTWGRGKGVGEGKIWAEEPKHMFAFIPMDSSMDAQRN